MLIVASDGFIIQLLLTWQWLCREGNNLNSPEKGDQRDNRVLKKKGQEDQSWAVVKGSEKRCEKTAKEKNYLKQKAGFHTYSRG